MTNAAAVALELADAALRRRALPTPFTDAEPDLEIETAYAIQSLVVRARLDAGSTVVGAKLGLTSRAKQERMNVDQPLYGWLTSDMLQATGSKVDLDSFIHPRVEPEIAFRIGETPTVPASVASVLAATQAVLGAIEIIDSRYDGFRFRLPDVVADNASSAAFLVGSVALPPDQVGDLRLMGCVLRENGAVVATAAGAAVLGHPAESVAWLVNQLALRGQQLEPGSIVLSGGLTDAVALATGGVVCAEFDGLGTVEVYA